MRQMELLLDVHESFAHFHALKHVFETVNRTHVSKRFDERFLRESEIAAFQKEKNESDERELGSEVIFEDWHVVEDLIVNEIFDFVVQKELIELDRLTDIDHIRTYVKFFEENG